MNNTPHFAHTTYTGTPNSVSSSHTAGTFVMSASPVRDRRVNGKEDYSPTILSTIGQRPACLVSASVTYVGNNEIYAFGGFDQYTDEVYNHVLRLNLDTKQWNLVDNYGDIPGVRMGHTATLWNDKVLIFGGENEHRAYLNDLIIFDIKTAHWHQPDITGPIPRGRARHAATLFEDKLFIVGGLSGHDNNTILDDFCYLNLKTWEWSQVWRFVPRFDHTCWVWGSRIWVFGGLTEGMERVNDIWWLDPKNPALNGDMSIGSQNDRRTMGVARTTRPASYALTAATGTPYAANSSSVQTNTGGYTARKAPMAPGTIASLNFVSGASIPSQSTGTHFHAFSSGCLLDFVTPAITTALDNSLCALDLETMRWEKLADGRDLFDPLYRWHYCTLNPEGTKAWLLGCPREPSQTHNGNGAGEYLSDVLVVDLVKLGLLGNDFASGQRHDNRRMPTSDTHTTSHLSAIGADLARMFDRACDTGNGSDFIITANAEDSDDDEDELDMPNGQHISSRASKPIHVHRLILESRWPHFEHMMNTHMAEFHNKKLHLPEPYSVVRAFVRYLYTDSIASNGSAGPSLIDVAGMLVMSNIYDMPRLRILCRNRLGRELDVMHAATIWERAGEAGEEMLKRRAARFCLTFWGRVVRTEGFVNLKKSAMAELCAEIDTEGRVLGADELESVGGLGGARFGGPSNGGQRRRLGSAGAIQGELDDADDDDMELS